MVLRYLCFSYLLAQGCNFVARWFLQWALTLPSNNSFCVLAVYRDGKAVLPLVKPIAFHGYIIPMYRLRRFLRSNDIYERSALFKIANFLKSTCLLLIDLPYCQYQFLICTYVIISTTYKWSSVWNGIGKNNYGKIFDMLDLRKRGVD